MNRSAQGRGAEALLLGALREPRSACALRDDEWDTLVRVGRACHLLGVLHARIERLGILNEVPDAAREQLRSERALCDYRRQMALWELDRVARTLAPLGVPIVLLKGVAYLAQGLDCAQGRALSDVDILVPRACLADVERTLRAQGWETASLSEYDEAYYREWSHELPPLRHGGALLELDVHHTILPPLGRIRLDTDALFTDAVKIPGSRLAALSPEDQLLHVSLHLFQDSDCTNRLRDLVDIDSLVREFAGAGAFWRRLIERARRHGAGRPLWYALRFAQRLLATEIPYEASGALREFAPNALATKLMDGLVGRTLMPPHPDRGYGWCARAATAVLLGRALWLRFPLRFTAMHSLTKFYRWLTAGAVKAKPV